MDGRSGAASVMTALFGSSLRISMWCRPHGREGLAGLEHNQAEVLATVPRVSVTKYQMRNGAAAVLYNGDLDSVQQLLASESRHLFLGLEECKLASRRQKRHRTPLIIFVMYSRRILSLGGRGGGQLAAETTLGRMTAHCWQLVEQVVPKTLKKMDLFWWDRGRFFGKCVQEPIW